MAAPYVEQYNRAPKWVKIATISCIIYLILPDPLDWIPGIGGVDEILVAGIMLKLLHKYGALPDEDHRSPKDLLKEITGKDELR